MIYLIFILSLVAVTKGADWLVEGAVGLTRLWNISQIVVGATVVSLGTTLPEALISSLAAAQGKGDIVAGTAIGSFIFNAAVILGLSAVFKPPRLSGKDTFFKAGTMIGVLILFALLALDLHISRWDALLLAAVLILFIASNIHSSRRSSRNRNNFSKSDLYAYLFRLTLGIALVVGGAHYLLESGVEIALILGIPEAIIAITLFAVGSSLPELITAITAARKGYTDLVLGNVLGANTLNIVFVISAAGLIRPFSIAPEVLRIDVPFSLLIMGILILPAFFKKKITRAQGILSILSYFGYITFLILTR